jgi:hypothetical protein
MANQNNEVDGNLQGVLTLIHDALRNPHPASLREATLSRPNKDAGEGWGETCNSIGQNHYAAALDISIDDDFFEKAAIPFLRSISSWNCSS